MDVLNFVIEKIEGSRANGWSYQPDTGTGAVLMVKDGCEPIRVLQVEHPGGDGKIHLACLLCDYLNSVTVKSAAAAETAGKTEKAAAEKVAAVEKAEAEKAATEDAKRRRRVRDGKPAERQPVG